MTIALTSVGVLLLSACNGESPPDFRYRLTVEVETPEGLRSGSSVIEVRQSLARPGMNPAGRMISRRIRGEAVAVDLPTGQTLFALLRSQDDSEWAKHVMQMLAPKHESEPFAERFDNVLELEGEITLPRMWPTVERQPERSAYPMLVAFGDLDDPVSVQLVDPDDLAVTFGEGYLLKRVTVQLTDEPVTTGIEERLGWLENTQGALAHIPVSDYPESGTPLPLHATLTEAAFYQGQD